MGNRIFVVDGREFPDPDPNLKVDEIRQHMMNFFPELFNAESKESKRDEDTIIEFKVGTVLHSHTIGDIQAHLQSLTEIIQPYADRRQAQPTLAEYDREMPLQQPKASVSTTEVIEACLQAINVSPGTAQSYRGTWATFAKYYPILPTEPEPIEPYFKRYSNKRTAADVYTKLGILYRFASERLGIPNAMKPIRKPRFKAEEKRSLTLGQAKAVLETCRNDLELALVGLYLGHGLRRKEALQLNIGDIEDTEMFISDGKTKKECMPILAKTRNLLLKIADGRASDQPIFMSQFNQRLSERMTHIIVKSILRRAGINWGGCCHILRHSFATLTQEGGMSFPICQRLMRHSRRTMTEEYSHFSREFLKKQLETFSPVSLANRDEKLPKIAY